jgi:hypothetical protein
MTSSLSVSSFSSPKNPLPSAYISNTNTPKEYLWKRSEQKRESGEPVHVRLETGSLLGI